MHIANVEKSRAKSPPKKRKGNIANLIPGKGRGPGRGAPNAGRPPDWWKERMRELRDRFLIAAEAKGVVDDPDHPQWAKVGTWVHEQLEGRAKQAVDVTTQGEKLTTQTIIIGGREITF